MKRTLLLLLLCVSVIFISRADSGTLPSNYMGVISYQDYDNEMAGFTLPKGIESIYSIDSEIDGANFRWGTWAEDVYVGAWRFGSEEDGFSYLYKSYHPITKEWKVIGDGDGKPNLGLGILNQTRDICYDYVTKKVYLTSQGKLYTNDLTNATFTEVGTLTDNLKPSAIAFNKAGELYAIICPIGGPSYSPAAAKLYKVDKTTAQATLIGELGIDITFYAQGATFDYNTDVLYFHGSLNNEFPITYKTYTIDITTGAATEVTSMSGVGIIGMASVFYTKNVPPGKVTDLSLVLNGEDANKIDLTFTIPTVDINGKTSNSAAKAIIYKLNEFGDYVEVETIASVTPGDIITKSYAIAGEGTYNYAVEILTTEGRSSGKAAVEFVNILPITMPYLEDFTNPNANMSLLLTDEGSIYFSSDNGVDNSASIAFKKGATDNKMHVTSIPFEKGATYGFSFYAKTTKESQDVLRYLINEETNWNYINIPVGDTYQKYSLENYIAKDTKSGSFTFYKHLTTDTEIIYVDNLLIEMLSPATVPAKSTIVKVEAAPLGEKKAIVTVKTPELDMAGNALSGLTGVKIEYSTNTTKTANYGMQEFPTTQMGEEISFSVPIDKDAGSYYFFVSAYNSDGYCYDIARSSTVWVGEEVSPAIPQNVQVVNEAGGKVKLTWDPVVVGANNGYIEADKITYSVSYYGGGILDGVPEVIYDINATEYITRSLPVGVFTFTVKAHYKETAGRASSAKQILSKDREEQHIVAEYTGTIYNYEGYPFLSYVTTNTPNISGISQMTYSVEDMGGAMYIDSLYFFTAQSSYRVDAELPYQISLGYKDVLEFADNTDYVSNDQLQVVFDGTVTFDKTTSVIAIPIEGFYYDGTKPLLVQFAKTLGGGTSIDTYIKSTPGSNRGIVSKSNTVDLTEIDDISEYPAGKNFTSVPSFVVTKNMNLATISGLITSEETGLPMENVSVKITSVEGENEKPLSVEVFTNADGEYEFATLPFNEYVLTASAAGFVDFVHNFTVAEVQTIELDIEMEGANKIKIEGSVINLNNAALEGVEVIISRTEEIERMTTGVDGTFEFMVYGSTNYTLTFNKNGMTDLTKDVAVLAEDIELEAVTLRYQIVPVTSVTASLNTDGSAAITWTASNPLPVNGYRVYRGTAEQTFDQYTLLTTNPVTGTAYTDESLKSVEYGVFKYAVCTDWYGDDLSAPVYSEEIEKDMFVDVTVNVNTNGVSPNGASLTLSNNKYTYNATADITGKAVFEDVRRAQRYSLNITLEYHNAVTMAGIEIDAAKNIESDELVEIIASPVIGETSSVENIIEINWSMSNTVNPTGFEVYLDNELKEKLSVSTLNYVFRNLSAGEHVVGVKAIFVSGDSDMAVKTFDVEGLVKPAYLNVDVKENKAELTWSPGGFTDPLKYEVYLNDELVSGNVTEDKYLFENLANGNYKAGVVAVYENGKSDKGEISFTVNCLNIESISASILAYPNPTTNGLFMLELQEAASVKIYSVNGVLITNEKYTEAGTYEMNLSAHQAGVYFVQIANNNTVRTIKMIYNK
ncbi:carboxypeptidase regulatory-like domain-containing protein [Bacteroidales bacterium OttesenSCG-928-I14]|nr:carboxypeptidase regulatory-like domain-containing protein [Bacteroidales bacterium OttesenSCG-928-I14]